MPNISDRTYVYLLIIYTKSMTLGDCQFLAYVIIEQSGIHVMSVSLFCWMGHNEKSTLVSGAFWEGRSSFYFVVFHEAMLYNFCDFFYPTVFHHNQVALAARSSLKLSRHLSLSSITPGKSMWRNLQGNVAYEFVLSSLAVPPNFFRLTWMVYEMRGNWLNNSCFVGCCFTDLFKIACSILV